METARVARGKKILQSYCAQSTVLTARGTIERAVGIRTIQKWAIYNFCENFFTLREKFYNFMISAEIFIRVGRNLSFRDLNFTDIFESM